MRVARDIVKPIVTLTLITLVVAAALAFTYQVTKPEEAAGPDMAQINEQGKVAMPEADSFEQLSETAEGATYLFKAKNNAGILVQGEAIGYNKTTPIVFLVGFDADGKITGLSVLSQEETPGLGDNITKPEFAQQLIGKDGEIGLKTGGQNSIDGIAGATYSSEGMCEGINNARKAFETVKGALS